MRIALAACLLLAAGPVSAQRYVLPAWPETCNTERTMCERAEPSLPIGTPSIATGQVAVTTGATLIVPAQTGRASVTITSTSATAFYIGGPGVTTTTGAYIAAAAGASITLPTAAAVYAVGAAALTVSYVVLF
jgi:hypothetical protein